MTKTNFTNVAAGARGIRDVGGDLHMIEPGQSASLEVDKHELEDAKAGKQFAINGKKPRADDDEPEQAEGQPAGVLDQGLKGVQAHLNTVTDIDELTALGAQEAANADRTGVKNAIQDRIDEIQKQPA